MISAAEDLPVGLSAEQRLAELSEAHQRGIRRFHQRLRAFVESGHLNRTQSELVAEHVLRLGERNRNPANTGNLEDLFTHTLLDTRDPIRAYAQVLADSVKVVPMDDDALLVPAISSQATGQVFRRVRDLRSYNPADVMLITHTMVAYGDTEMRASSAAFVRATLGPLSEAETRRHVARMAVQSQHAPSSTFVLARMHGLTMDLADLYREAGYSPEQIADAERFYGICARFRPEWARPFLDGVTPQSPEWHGWRRAYLEERVKLPDELIYQLASDTLTNFLDGTLESGKWTDASIVFGGVSDPAAIPSALARIVNQYLAEHLALHDRPAVDLTEKVQEPLEPWGVGFQQGRAIALPGAPRKAKEIRAQFESAWARKTRAKTA